MNEYNVTVKDLEFKLQATTALDAIEVESDTFHILKGQKSYNAKVLASDFASKTFTIEVNGTTHEVKIEDHYDQLVKQLGLSVLTQQKANDIKAPMPGLVLAIEVEEGQEVKKGDGLLILEAMKMENIIKSAGDGRIKTIQVETGTAVDKGQLLIEME